jgi:hypothetical protein
MRLRPHCVALFFVAFVVGCGGPAPNANDPRCPTAAFAAAAGDETPAVPAGLDGTWFLTEPGDEDVEGVLVVRGGVAELRDSDRGPPTPVRVAPMEDGAHVLSWEGGGERLYLIPRSETTAIVLRPGAREYRVARRGGPLPEFLQGLWSVVDPRGRRDTMRLDIQGDIATLLREGRPRRMRFHGLLRDGSSVDIAAERLDERGDFAWFRVTPVGVGVFLLHIDDDETAVAHREGMAPSWLGSLATPRETPPAAVEAVEETR